MFSEIQSVDWVSESFGSVSDCDFTSQKHGFGLEYYASGAIYQGQFKSDCRHGLGIYTWSSGLSYGGSWFGGIQHGEGVETNINLTGSFSPGDHIWVKSMHPVNSHPMSSFASSLWEQLTRCVDSPPEVPITAVYKSTFEGPAWLHDQRTELHGMLTAQPRIQITLCKISFPITLSMFDKQMSNVLTCKSMSGITNDRREQGSSQLRVMLQVSINWGLMTGWGSTQLCACWRICF